MTTAGLLAISAVPAIPAPLAADPPVCVRGVAAIESGARSASASWDTPLDRIVSLHIDGGTLGAALDDLSRETNIRFSYSTEFVAAGTPVCVDLTSVPLGDALRALVRAAAVDPDHENLVHPAVTAADHVVLAPVPGALVGRVAMPSPEQVVRLERIVVTGEPGDLATSGASRSGFIIDADEIAALGFRELGSVLASVVPGFGSWPSAFGGMASLPSGTRGATSFSGSRTAVYIDGIRVSDALAIATLPPESVERIEVVRGPAGAVLFGAEAMGGVVHIRSRNGLGADGRRGLQFRSTAGLASEEPVAGSWLSHDHVLAGWAGSPARSAAFSLSGGTSGDAIPGSSSRYLAFFGNGQAALGSGNIAATARAAWARSHAGTDPYAETHFAATGGSPAWKWKSGSSVEPFLASNAGDRSLLNYTLGITASFGSSERWTHSVVAGVDGYRRVGAAGMAPAGTGYRAMSLPADGDAVDRITLRGVSRLDAITTNEVDGDVLFVADYSRLRAGDAAGTLATPGVAGAFRNDRHGRSAGLSRGHSAAGMGVQAVTSVRDRLFLDAGLRVQANEVEGGSAEVRALPMIGASLELGGGTVEATLRASWGAAVRPAATVDGAGSFAPAGTVAGSATTREEAISGFEAGVDVRIADHVTIGVTRFDQRATGPVAVAFGNSLRASPAREAGSVAAAPESGEIAGSGWEASSSVEFGSIAVRAAFASVDSRVSRLPANFTGGLREGDRVPHLPAITSGFAASWMTPRGSFSLTASRAWNWLDYNRGAGSRSAPAAFPAGEGGTPEQPGLGWRSFDGGTILGASASFAVRPGLNILWGVENLLGERYSPPVSAGSISGRDFFVGLRATF